MILISIFAGFCFGVAFIVNDGLAEPKKVLTDPFSNMSSELTQEDDVPSVPADSKNVIVGTNGDDFIEGTPKDDLIYGLKADDQIYGFAGKDLIINGKANVIIDGVGITMLFTEMAEMTF